MSHRLKYRVLQERLAGCRAAANAQIPAGALEGAFFCVMRTADELSLVCAEDRVPWDRNGIAVEGGWVALRLEGPFPFSMTGVLASFLDPLAEAGIPIFAISTFGTDYVLVKSEDLQKAVAALGGAGHEEYGS